MDIKLIIFGSRSLYNEESKRIIIDIINELGPVEIITSGETRGVCEIARDIAKQFAIPLKLHWLNRDKYAGGIFEHRARECLMDGNYCLLIHDGISKGTMNEYKIAQKMGIKCKYITINNELIQYTLTQTRFEFN